MIATVVLIGLDVIKVVVFVVMADVVLVAEVLSHQLQLLMFEHTD